MLPKVRLMLAAKCCHKKKYSCILLYSLSAAQVSCPLEKRNAPRRTYWMTFARSSPLLGKGWYGGIARLDNFQLSGWSLRIQDSHFVCAHQFCGGRSVREELEKIWKGRRLPPGTRLFTTGHWEQLPYRIISYQLVKKKWSGSYLPYRIYQIVQLPYRTKAWKKWSGSLTRRRDPANELVEVVKSFQT